MSRRYGIRPLPTPPIISLASRCAYDGMRPLATPATGASPWSDAADFILCYPFILDTPTTIYKVWWANGSAAGGNSDVAVYDEDYNFIVGTGASTAGSGSDVPQAVALTATTVLPPGRYYAGMSHNATTTNQIQRYSITTTGIALFMAAGCFKSSATDTPPIAASAITPADLTNVAFPNFGLITRTGFDL